MEYTTNYHLPQWVKTDRIMMDDFNQMCQDMEAGLNTAVGTAAQAKEVAQAAAEALPYAVGSYTGDGATYRNIDVGFQPSFVIICGDQRTHNTSYAGLGILGAGAGQSSGRLYMTGTGFRLDGSDTNAPYPQMNKSGTIYDYIAFK